MQGLSMYSMSNPYFGCLTQMRVHQSKALCSPLGSQHTHTHTHTHTHRNKHKHEFTRQQRSSAWSSLTTAGVEGHKRTGTHTHTHTHTLEERENKIQHSI